MESLAVHHEKEPITRRRFSFESTTTCPVSAAPPVLLPGNPCVDFSLFGLARADTALS